MEDHTTPKFQKEVFSCPHCHITATQVWLSIYKKIDSSQRGTVVTTQKQVPELFINICTHCNNQTLWYNKQIIYPITPSAPLPHKDMPNDVKEDYLEAREIVDKSPRAAAALLRLAVEKLLPQIGATGKGINEKIGSLVKKGLDEHTQKSLDIVRVIGNQAVHPGQIDLKDDLKTTILLFDLINLIVETKISHPKKIDSFYDILPEKILNQIKKRDKK